jgi:hypothetical protein
LPGQSQVYTFFSFGERATARRGKYSSAELDRPVPAKFLERCRASVPLDRPGQALRQK